MPHFAAQGIGVVEAEVVSNDRYRETSNENTTHGTDTSDDIPPSGHWNNVTIPHGGDCDDTPPEACRDGLKLVGLVQLGVIDACREDQHSDGHKEPE